MMKLSKSFRTNFVNQILAYSLNSAFQVQFKDDFQERKNSFNFRQAQEEEKEAIRTWEDLDGYFLSFHSHSDSFSLLYRSLDSVPPDLKKFYERYSKKSNKAAPKSEILIDLDNKS